MLAAYDCWKETVFSILMACLHLPSGMKKNKPCLLPVIGLAKNPSFTVQWTGIIFCV